MDQIIGSDTWIARGQRRLFVRIDAAWPWREQLATAFSRLQALPLSAIK